jgi:hypothetical protein
VNVGTCTCTCASLCVGVPEQMYPCLYLAWVWACMRVIMCERTVDEACDCVKSEEQN